MTGEGPPKAALFSAAVRPGRRNGRKGNLHRVPRRLPSGAVPKPAAGGCVRRNGNAA